MRGFFNKDFFCIINIKIIFINIHIYNQLHIFKLENTTLFLKRENDE